MIIMLGGLQGQCPKQLSYLGRSLHLAEGCPFFVFKFPLSLTILSLQAPGSSSFNKSNFQSKYT